MQRGFGETRGDRSGVENLRFSLFSLSFIEGVQIALKFKDAADHHPANVSLLYIHRRSSRSLALSLCLCVFYGALYGALYDYIHC